MVKKEHIGKKVFVKRLNSEIVVCPENEELLKHFGLFKYLVSAPIAASDKVKKITSDTTKKGNSKQGLRNTDGKSDVSKS
jgi:hypothetical protein